MQDQYRYVLGAALRPLNSARSRKGERAWEEQSGCGVRVVSRARTLKTHQARLVVLVGR